MIRNILLASLLGCLISSCTIEESTRFNKDFSGTSVTKVDISAMMTFMSSMDTSNSGKGKMYQDIQKGLDSANNSPDMQKYKLNMKFDTVSNAISVSYSFKNLDEANSIAKSVAERQQPGMTAKSTYRWEKKDKVLIMPGIEDLSQALGDQGSNPMMQGMTISITRSFPKTIVKVSDSRFVISSDKKSLSLKATIDELEKNPLKDVAVTFK